MKTYFWQPPPTPPPMREYEVDLPEDAPDPLGVGAPCPFCSPIKNVRIVVYAIDYKAWEFRCSAERVHPLPERVLQTEVPHGSGEMVFFFRTRTTGFEPIAARRVR